LPDRQILIPQVGMKYVEVKWKSAPVEFRQSGTLRHGIDLPNWRHYLQLEEEAMVQIGLALVQVRTHRASTEIVPRLLFQTVLRLAKSIADILDRPINGFPRGAVYWEVDVFQDLGLIGDLFGSGPIPQTKLALHPWERPAKDGSLPQPRPVRQLRLKW